MVLAIGLGLGLCNGSGARFAVFSISPSVGYTAGDSPHAIAVSGTVSSVTIGGTPCTDVTQSGSTVYCLAPAKAAGTYDVVITGPDGATATLVNGYRAWNPSVDFATARFYEAGSGITHTSNAVTAWTDQGSNAKDLSNSTSAERPTLVANRFGQNRNALVWDGVNNRLTLAAKDALASGASVFWVSKHIVSNEVPSFPTQQPSTVVVGQSDATIFRAAGFEGGKLALHNADVGWEKIYSATGQNDGSAHAWGVVHNTDGTLTFYKDSAAIATFDSVGASKTSSPYNTTWSAWDTIGAGLNGEDSFRGELSAVVVVPGVVSDPTKMLAWLRGLGVNNSYRWTKKTASAAWEYRDGAGIVALGDYLYMLGGWNPTVTFDGDTTTNEVWRTPLSDGATWTQLLAHDTNPPQTGAGARWTRRHANGWLKHTHNGVDYLYVIGADQEDGTPYPHDVWRSTDGITWERMTAAAEWGARALHMSASYDGALYVMGGQTDMGDVNSVLNDVWRSTDGGATWTQLADAGWAARGAVFNPVEFDGHLWVVGGGSFLYDPALRTYYNDVWKFDGSTWTEVLADGHSQWTQREYHGLVTYDGKLWVLNGYNATEGNIAEAICSPDGVTWTSQTIVPWTAGHADGWFGATDKIWHATGNGGTKDVWTLHRVEPE